MSAKNATQKIIHELSNRIVDAQRKIRILDLIKWDDSIKHSFLQKKGKQMPQVTEDYYHNRPLPFELVAKIEEFHTIARDAQNELGQYSPMTRLISRRCAEYIRSVEMLSKRGTPAFSELSMELYGSPNDVFYPGGPRLSDMGVLLFDVLTALDVQLQSEDDVKKYTPQYAQAYLQERLGKFFDMHPGKVTVVISDDMVADAAAGADSIKLSQNVMFSQRDLQYLEVHEGWVHVGTTLNGAEQPYCSFLSKGSPSCSVIQEGLAVITEVVSLSSNPARMRKITNRVIALDKVSQGANFLDIYHYFLGCGLQPEESYYQCVRIFRGSLPEAGAFTKDLSYAKGLVLIYNFIRFAISQHRVDAVPLLFLGKLSLDDIPLLQALQHQELLTPPMYLPPPFRDLSALSAWMSFSLFLNKFDLDTMQENFMFLLN